MCTWRYWIIPISHLVKFVFLVLTCVFPFQPDREFETFLPDSMRAPAIQVLGKPPHEYKGGSSTYPNHYEHPHPHNWEKRGGGRYHDDWDKRGSYGSGMLKISEGGRNTIFTRDAGRPPGRGQEADRGDPDGSQNVTTPTPVILSRARSNSENRSTSPNPSVTAVRYACLLFM